MTELLPCPFCGGEAQKSVHAFWHVGCQDKGCSGYEVYLKNYDTESEAIAAWNTRYHSEFEETVIKAWERIKSYQERTCRDVNEDDHDFTCSECGASMYTWIDDCWTMIAKGGHCDDVIEHPSYYPNCGARVIGENE